MAGCGLIAAKRHLPSLRALRKEVSLVGLCDRDLTLAQRMGQKFGVPRVYGDFSSMLSAEELDLVDICTPPATHAPLAACALERGIAVLMEKPMALTTSDCDKILEAASRSKRPIGVLHNQLFNPAFVRARELFLEGRIGDFSGMRIWLSTPTRYMTSQKDHWAHRLPGGVLGETGPHAVYLSLAFLENIQDVSVCARKVLPDYPWSRFEDFRIELLGKNGIGSIWLSYANDDWSAEIDLVGTKGALRVDLQAQTVLWQKRSSLTAHRVGLSTLWRHGGGIIQLAARGFRYACGDHTDSHRLGISRFIRALGQGAPDGLSSQMGRETVRVMEMIVQKLQETHP